MSVLGQPYRIMYLSKGVSGLTNVVGVVFKPDNTVAGVFPLTEVPGLFAGCYIYDYVSSTSDREGEYFSRVVSPSEDITDIVRFTLSKSGGGDAVQSLSPNPLVAYIMSGCIDATVLEAGKSQAVVDRSKLNASFSGEHALTAVVLDQFAEAQMSANETLAVPRYC